MGLYQRSIGSFTDLLQKVQIHYLRLHCPFLQGPQSPLNLQSPESLQRFRGNMKKEVHSSMIDINILQLMGILKRVVLGVKATGEGYLIQMTVTLLTQMTQTSIAVRQECENSDARKERVDFEEYKKKATIIVEEYFATDDITSTANELRELDRPTYSYYFVKKLVSKVMDRHDKEKEMAAVLLSGLYADYIDPRQVYKGFCKLVESADDFIVDIPDTVDVLALFIARDVVDGILPPAFLKKQMNYLPKDSKGIKVLKRAEKGYLAAPMGR
ncbi:hypothetical protein DVH24_037673 [Malus domestica]|uniref:MI domain-containing protein n=1 Tax=Malus domestica TaxID=3750 RepID=A0A498IXH2_MALDO|nr:hypothetical protein DVH24_037673 [Malus domestica]